VKSPSLEKTAIIPHDRAFFLIFMLLSAVSKRIGNSGVIALSPRPTVIRSWQAMRRACILTLSLFTTRSAARSSRHQARQNNGWIEPRLFISFFFLQLHFPQKTKSTLYF